MNDSVKWCHRQYQAWIRQLVSISAAVMALICAQTLGAQKAIATAHTAGDDARLADALLTRPVTITLKHVSLKQALDSISIVAKVLVQYRAPMLKAYPTPVSVHVVKVPLGVVLEHVLDGTKLHVVPDGQGYLTIVPSPEATGDSTPSTGTIVGRVVDSATGRGLPGATVKVVGTKLAITTASAGQFTILNVPAGARVLTVRQFGYRPAESSTVVAENDKVTVRVIMVSVPTVLSGVVTTATGLQRKVEVGNDMTTINVDSVMRVAPISSVTDLLETRVPGLTVLHTSGSPGDPARLRLRGVGSLQLNNDPILIVDGVRVYANQSDARSQNLAPTLSSSGSGINRTPLNTYAAPSPIDQIDPNSIETVEVFKGPSATAIYGSDAANGVIVITTKHGRAGPTHWSLALGDGVNWLPGKWPEHVFRLGYDHTHDYVAGYGGLCLWTNQLCTVDSVVSFQALNDPRYTVFSHGEDQTASLTVSGGVPTLQYGLSGSVTKDVGNLKLPAIERQRYEQFYGPVPRWMLRPDNYQTWGVSGQLSAQPSTTSRVTLTSSLFNSTQQRSSLQQAIGQLQGEYINADTVYSITGDPFVYSLGSRPLITGDVEQATDHQITATNALTLSWQPYPWLPLTATGGLNTIQRTDQTYIPYGVNFGGAGPCGEGLNSCADTTGSYGLGRGTSQDNTLTVGTAIPLFRQRLTVAVGGNYHSSSTADFQAYTDQLAPGVSQPTSFNNCPQLDFSCFTNQITSAASTYGWYMEPRLNFHSRFFVAPGFRLDGGSGGSRVTSTGGFTSGLSAFPKIDFSWIAVDRQGQRPLGGILTLLRPRVAFGLAGTQPGPADKLRLFNVGQYRLSSTGRNGDLAIESTNSCGPTLSLDGGSTTVPAVCLNSLGNTQLRPERSRELEGGFDATLWQGRLTLTYTQYTKTRTDAILAVPVAPSVVSVGGDQVHYQKNIGVIRNTGTEMTANAFVFQSRVVSWNIGANLSNDNNVVVRLNPGQSPFCLSGTFGDGGSCVKPGYPLFGLWARPIVSFADANHDRLIDPTEIRLADSAVFLGQANPKYQFNLNTSLTVLNGRLSVNAAFAYQNGLTQINSGALTSGGFFALAGASNASLAAQAAVVADCNAIPSYSSFASLCPSSGQFSPIGFTQTVNTFRFNEFSLNYEAPAAVSTLLRIPRLTLALQGSNLALHSNYRGKDPNVNAFSTVSAGDETRDLGEVPEPRTWRLKVNLGN